MNPITRLLIIAFLVTGCRIQTSASCWIDLPSGYETCIDVPAVDEQP